MKKEYVIFSSEGFWSNINGWSLYKEEADILLDKDVDYYKEHKEHLPLAKDNDIQLIDIERTGTWDYEEFLKHYDNVCIEIIQESDLSKMIEIFNKKSTKYKVFETECFDVLYLKK